MARRRGRSWRCPCGKTGFSSWRIASQAAARLAEHGWIYWCRRGGCYHLTRQSPADYGRRRSLAGAVA